MKPTGEGWVRGWNLVAYRIYVAPAVLIVGGLHVWRQQMIGLKYTSFDVLALILAFIFPAIPLVVIKLKS